MLRAVALLSLFGLVACGDSTSLDAGIDASSPRDGGPGDGSTDSGSSGPTDSGPADSGPTDSGPTDSGRPSDCGGLSGLTCGPDQYCDHFENLCGADDRSGFCRPRPTDCADVSASVCGCDGVVYESVCVANRSGSDVNVNAGGCAATAGVFACGFRFCATDTYCMAVFNFDFTPAYQCRTFPAGCEESGPDCACLSAEPCGDVCAMSADGDLTLTCPDE